MKDRCIPTYLLLRWIDELTKLSDLMEVLLRSVSYTEFKYGGESDTRICMGDDELIRIIRDRLTDLFVEIEEVNDGHLDIGGQGDPETGSILAAPQASDK